ncbi:MAG: phosphoglycerate kinase [Deltaproteobacteria bacterium]|nr:phosphoglycerate kinase [Deltaproteobacteria bacterium]
MPFRRLEDLALRGKRVFVRVDFNVPLDRTGHITDDTRILAALPTLRYASERGARLVLASHLGRPKGPDPALSLAPVARRLGEQLGCPVPLAPDCVGPEVERLVAGLKPGEMLLLENLRFHKQEEENDPQFARALAALADVYVNDAFGTAHRAHASTEGMVAHVPEAAAGLLMQRELDYLGRALAAPQRPFIAVLGGAKVSDKIGVIRHLLSKVDELLIGGAMAFTFLKAQGHEVGRSRVEADKIGLAAALLGEEAATRKLRLPADHVVAERPEPGVATQVVPTGQIPPGLMGLDIGPETAARYATTIRGARTVVWNGPMGVFEVPLFRSGTLAVARALAEVQGLTVVGGGDSVAALTEMGLADKVSHVSTGGGASLEYLEGRALPGVVALERKG